MNVSAEQATYRAYFVGERLNIDGVEQIVADDDQTALSTAEKLFTDRPAAISFTLMGPAAKIIATRRR